MKIKMIKTGALFLLTLFSVNELLADIVPPRAATQAEVIAGQVGNAFVSPLTLAGSGIGGNTNALTPSQSNTLAMAAAILPGALTNGTYILPTVISLNGVEFGSEGENNLAAGVVEDKTYSHSINFSSATLIDTWYFASLFGNTLNVTNTITASNFVGQLSGTNIIADTINSNKLDAATRALLGTGNGVDTSAITNAYYTNTSTIIVSARQLGLGTNNFGGSGGSSGTATNLVGDFQPYAIGNATLSQRKFPIDRIIMRGCSTFIESSHSNYVTDQLLVSTIERRFKTNILFQLGYNTINICDGWWQGRNPVTKLIDVNPTNYPYGMRWCMDNLHSNGFYGVLYMDDKQVYAPPTAGPFYPAWDAADLGIITPEMFSNTVVQLRDWGVDGFQWDNRRGDPVRARYNTEGWSYWISTLYPSCLFISYGSSLTNADWVATIPAGVNISPDGYTGFPKAVTNSWNGVDTLAQAHKLPQWRANCSDACYLFGDDSGFNEYVDWLWCSTAYWTAGRPVFALPKFSAPAVCQSYGDQKLDAIARQEWTFASTFHQPFDIIGTAAFVAGFSTHMTNQVLLDIQRDPLLSPPTRLWYSNSISAWVGKAAYNGGSTILFFWNRATNHTTWESVNLPLSLLGIGTNQPIKVTDIFFGTNCTVANYFPCTLTNQDARMYFLQYSNAVPVHNGDQNITLNGNPPPFQQGAVGLNSFAVGYQPTASGNYSFSANLANTSSGQNSASFGRLNTASGVSSFSAGDSSVASGNLSFALGNGNTAGGSGYNFAIGQYATVNGFDAIEIALDGNPHTNAVSNSLQIDAAKTTINGPLYANGEVTVSNALTVTGNANIGGTLTANGAGLNYGGSSIANSNRNIGDYASSFGQLNFVKPDWASTVGRFNHVGTPVPATALITASNTITVSGDVTADFLVSDSCDVYSVDHDRPFLSGVISSSSFGGGLTTVVISGSDMTDCVDDGAMIWNLTTGANNTFGSSEFVVGQINTTSYDSAGVFGGMLNIASGVYSTVLNGVGNTASGQYSAILGGTYNKATALNSFVIGSGLSNGVPNSTLVDKLQASTITASNFVATAKTNQITFWSTNASPANITTPVKWVSVQISGETNMYRLPLYQ